MTLVGIGTDLVEISRFQKALDRQGFAFIETILTQDEIAYCQKFNDPLPHFAVRFAAKEAIVKALGTGFRNGLNFQDITIKNDENGKPECFFSEKLKKQFPNIEMLLSLSHTDNYSLAMATCTLKE
ncbi:MAG: Holo-[acyl-carrier-protein] synthase [Chlamydiae bacterium]|nr:Holo-[acyl-carrier-protein] synthase [Chlamydiota bacterium]